MNLTAKKRHHWNQEDMDNSPFLPAAVPQEPEPVEVEMEVEGAPGRAQPHAQSQTQVPPGQKKPKVVVASAIAWMMDEIIPIPGTKLKVGLDPLFGLLPGGGDLASSSISCVALLEAVRRGLPFRAVRQMSVNILLNAGVGSIPVVGDIFSVVFRSNSRNRDIIKANLDQALAEGREPSWWPVIFVLLFVGGVVAASIALNLFLWFWLFSNIVAGVNAVIGA